MTARMPGRETGAYVIRIPRVEGMPRVEQPSHGARDTRKCFRWSGVHACTHLEAESLVRLFVPLSTAIRTLGT